ncbi:MAG: DUF1853 family protein [Proteobacteria bacterium]|nr:DUF1853 family protein [Pseudomonadota bacterium]
MSDYQYKTREVRDLAWTCFSPALFHSENLSDDGQNIANCGLGLTAPRQSWLRALDKRPAALHEHLKKLHSSRLGLYFESLWHFFLHCDAEVDLIAHNLPIRDKGHTLGEFDCLYYCRQRQRHFHLELAVKYYLSHRQSTSGQNVSHWNEWLGPSNTDHLDRKINHLIQRQIQLGDHPVARTALNKLGIDTLTKEVEIKGYLFQSLSDPLTAPYAHNCQNRLCRWLTIEELESYLDTLDSSRFYLLPKAQWLAPANFITSRESLLDGSLLNKALSEHFQLRGRPQLVSAIDKLGNESQRFFVTGLLWPANSGQPGKAPAPL